MCASLLRHRILSKQVQNHAQRRFRDASSAMTWFPFCERTHQVDGSDTGMCMHESELEVAKNFLLLSTQDPDQFSLLSVPSVMYVSTAFVQANSGLQEVESYKAKYQNFKEHASCLGCMYRIDRCQENAASCTVTSKRKHSVSGCGA